MICSGCIRDSSNLLLWYIYIHIYCVYICVCSNYVEELATAAGLENTAVNVTAPGGQATVCGLDEEEVCADS